MLETAGLALPDDRVYSLGDQGLSKSSGQPLRLRWREGGEPKGQLGFSQRAVAIGPVLLTDRVLRYAAIIWLGTGIVAWAFQASWTIRRELVGMGAVGAGLLAVVAMAYLASLHDLASHLDRSADRLLMHPSLVLFAGAAIGLIWSSRETRRASTGTLWKLR